MVWRDYWLLEKWVTHNSRIVPKSQLYVVNHGGDPKVDAIAAGCNLIHIPRDEVTIDLTRRRWTLVGNITSGLLAFYDRVICTDVDELLLYVGDKSGFLAHLESVDMADVAALSPVGLNLMATDDDGSDPDASVLQNHPNALLSARYTKPCIVAGPVTYTIGGHGLIGQRFRIDPDILLFHLHYVTPDYTERMAARQEIVAQSKEHNAAQDTPQDMPKGFWTNWSKPGRIRDKELGAYADAREVDVSNGFQGCAQLLEGAILYRGKRMLIEPKALGAEGAIRVTVPEALRPAI
jgi:hypothetical protein